MVNSSANIMYSWSAVVRGAAAKGLEGDGRAPIKKRKCRRHYGTGCGQVFDPDKHRESDAYMCAFTNRKRAGDQMSWLVNKGQDLSTDDSSHAEKDFLTHFWHGDNRTTTISLQASDQDDAPQRKSETVRSSLPFWSRKKLTISVCIQAGDP